MLFLAWLGLFAGISVLLWAAIQFWGRNLKLVVPAGSLSRPGGMRVLPPPNNTPVLELEEVTESNDKPSFVGRMVRFEGVTVKGAGRRTFRVGRDGGNTLLVAPSEPEDPGVRDRQKVTVQGLILNVPGAADIQKQWGIDAAHAAQIAHEQIFLRASTIDKR